MLLLNQKYCSFFLERSRLHLACIVSGHLLHVLALLTLDQTTQPVRREIYCKPIHCIQCFTSFPTDSDSDKSLFDWIQEGNVEAVERLLAEDADAVLNARDDQARLLAALPFRFPVFFLLRKPCCVLIQADMLLHPLYVCRFAEHDCIIVGM